MNRFCFFLVAALTNNFLFGQNDSTTSIEQEILSQEVDILILSKGRAALLDNLTEKNYEKSIKVLGYLNNKLDTSKVKVFYQAEEMLISFWLGTYDRIFSIAVSQGGDLTGNKLEPQPDLFYVKLKEASQQETALLKEKIKKSDLPPYKRDFLYLVLKDILEREGYYFEEGTFQIEMNKLTDEYFLMYKDSEFNPFIRRYMRFVVAESPWGYGFETSIGSLTLPTDLNRYMSNYFLLSIAFEAAYKKIYCSLRMDVGAAHKLRKGFIYNGTWKDDLTVMHVGGALTGGYMFDLGNNFTLTPNAGIGWLDFSPPDQESNKEGNDVYLSFGAWALGINMDIPIGGKDGSTYIRLHGGHRIAMTDFEPAKGGYTFISLGIDLFGRPKYREY